MPSEPSKYAENQFLNATVGRIPMMDELMAYTAPRLTTAANQNADFDDANRLFTAAHKDWNAGLTVLVNALAAQPSATYALTDKLASLTRKPDAETNSPMETWDNAVRSAVAYQGSTYLYLLPRGRETLTTGGIDDQIDAIRDFSIRLKEQTAKPALVTLGGTVDAFASAVRALRAHQEEKASAVEQARLAQEALRVRCASVLYGIIGFAMWIWRDTPAMVDTLFDVNLLRGPALTVPDAPTNTTWTPGSRTLATTALPTGATRVEAWRLAPGGAPEMIATSATGETFAVVPETIVFQPGVRYQLWLEGLNSKGNSTAGPIQVWTAPVA